MGAVQAGAHRAWQELRAAESALGLPATRLAAGLRPIEAPSRLVVVFSERGGILTAAVMRK